MDTMKEKVEKLEKENRMMTKIFNLTETSQGISFGPSEFYILEVEKLSDEAILITASNKDTFFLNNTRDDRKVDDNGSKYSYLRILYLKKKLVDIPADFIRKGDRVLLSGIFAQGFRRKDHTETVGKALKGKLPDEQLKIVMDELKAQNTLNLVSTEMHYYGFSMKPLSLSDETVNAIKEYKEVEKKRKEEERQAYNAAINPNVEPGKTADNSHKPVEPEKPIETEKTVEPEKSTEPLITNESSVKPTVNNNQPEHTSKTEESKLNSISGEENLSDKKLSFSWETN